MSSGSLVSLDSLVLWDSKLERNKNVDILKNISKLPLEKHSAWNETQNDT